MVGGEGDEREDGPGLIDLDMGAFGSGSMTDPLRHAMGLRSAQDKCKMRMWDSFPSLFQNTIFHGEQDKSIKDLRRDGSLEQRLERARGLKADGNEVLRATTAQTAVDAPAAPKPPTDLKPCVAQCEARVAELREAVLAKELELKELRGALKAAEADLQAALTSADPIATPCIPELPESVVKSLEDAVTKYERAAGILRYVECTMPNWKNDDGSYKGIEDVHLRVDTSALDGDSPEAAEARELVVSCYLNIALASQKLGKFDQMKQACDEVLNKVNPDSVKALFRRAQARLGPVGALDADRDAAIRDLMAAAQRAPQDKEVRGLLAKLRSEKKAKEASERSTFAGLFDRGTLVDEEADKPDAPAQPKKFEDDPSQWDLRDPRVQRMLDIYPGPDSFPS